jgi:protein-tyrosine-phosphatase
MAEAIARHLAADVIEASSAGLTPFGDIPTTTIAVLAERGFSAKGQSSKPLSLEELSAADLLINVGDPFGLDLAVYRRIRDQIETRVEDLAQRLRDKVNVRQSA